MLVLYAASPPKSWSAKSLQFTTRILHDISSPAISYCNLFPGFQFQKHEVLDTVDHLLSKNPAGLNEDGIQLVKVRVLNSAQGFFETAFTSNKYAIYHATFIPYRKHTLDLDCMTDA